MLTLGLCKSCKKETFNRFEICADCLKKCPQCGNVADTPGTLFVERDVTGHEYIIACEYITHRVVKGA